MDEIAFDDRGLVPCIAQDWRTGEVLTLAYMNREALDRTRASGQVHFFSRSRGRLWRKGETSGNVLEVKAIRADCDRDAVLVLVDPAGPACHTGERSCFHNGDSGPIGAGEALPALARTIAGRRREASPDSYTAKLLADPQLAAAKVREEADEVVRAVADESEQRVAEEAADLLYHLAVLMAGRDVALTGALEELNERRR